VTPRGHLGSTVAARAAAYCAERRAFLVLDAPAGWRGADAAKAVAYRFEHRANAALCLPRVRNGRRNLPGSGAVAGAIARTDLERGVWKAPAGRGVLLAVDGLAVELEPREHESLNAAGISTLRTMVGTGVVGWGARTLAGSQAESSDWKYVNVRRLLLFLEASIDEGTSWVVFEPNDEPLWARVRRAVEDFLTVLWREGAFQGSKPEEAFFVRCDRSTMTQGDIDHGRLIVLVGVAPVRPAEFVVFRIRHCTKAA
jgi:phage tail sheath protein FI